MGRAREERILDAAGELLLTFGYRRVTVDDVARRAGVGKGTVYLHWSSKLELFAAVLLRDVASIVEAQLAAMRADPAEIQLHRTMRTLFLLVMRRPLARAFYTGDSELLGALIGDTKVGLRSSARRRRPSGPPTWPRCTSTACSPTTRRPIRACTTGCPARRRASSCSSACYRRRSISSRRGRRAGRAGPARLRAGRPSPNRPRSPRPLPRSSNSTNTSARTCTAHSRGVATVHHARPHRNCHRPPRTSRPCSTGCTGCVPNAPSGATATGSGTVFRHADVEAVLRDPATFSSNTGRIFPAAKPVRARHADRTRPARSTARCAAWSAPRSRRRRWRGLEPRIRHADPVELLDATGERVRPGRHARLPAAGDRDRRAARAARRRTARLFRAWADGPVLDAGRRPERPRARPEGRRRDGRDQRLPRPSSAGPAAPTRATT